MISVVFQTHGKADISRGMKQYVVPFGTHHIQGADHTAQHAIFIADVLRLESGHAVALLLPSDNGSVIFFRWIKISVCRMLHTLHHSLHNRWCGREIHVSYPHRDPVKAFLHLCARNRNVLYCNRIFSVAIQNRSKIVFHNHLFSFRQHCKSILILPRFRSIFNILHAQHKRLPNPGTFSVIWKPFVL